MKFLYTDPPCSMASGIPFYGVSGRPCSYPFPYLMEEKTFQWNSLLKSSCHSSQIQCREPFTLYPAFASQGNVTMQNPQSACSASPCFGNASHTRSTSCKLICNSPVAQISRLFLVCTPITLVPASRRASIRAMIYPKLYYL